MPSKKVIDPNLSFIQDEVYAGFRKRQYEAMGQNVREGMIHVSDLVQDCMRNTFYNKWDKTERYMDTGAMSIFFAGESVHRMIDSVYNDETKLSWDLVRDKKPDADSNPLDVLNGEYDAVYDVDVDGEKMKCIVDYKTWLSNGYKMSKPKEDHVRQINMYKYLIQKNTGVDIKYGSVVYLDFADRMSRPVVFTFALDPIEDTEKTMLVKLTELQDASNTGILPPRVKSWKCDGYCPYASRCFIEDEVPNSDLEVVE